MTIQERQMGSAVVLDLTGPLVGPRAVGLLEAALRKLAGRGLVVANLARVPSIDLGGMGALVEAFRTLRATGGVLRLAALTRRIHDLVVITRLLTVFDTYESVEDAAGMERALKLRAEPAISTLSLGRIRRFLHRA